MSFPDLIILLLLLGFALSGVRRGMLWEIFTVIGLFLGFWLTFFLRGDIIDLVSRFVGPGWGRQWAVGIAFLATFLIVYLGFTAIGHAIHGKIEKTAFKWPDRVLGVIAGILKGAVLVGMLVAATDYLDRDGVVRAFTDQSKLIRWGRYLTHAITHWEPNGRSEWV